MIPQPPARPCYEPNLDASECQRLKMKMDRRLLEYRTTRSLQIPNWKILPNETWSCPLKIPSTSPYTQGNIPMYAVKASNVYDVQTAVSFASKHNLRLVLKSSDHDYIGRSAAAGALSIWTNHLNKIDLHENFVPSNSTSE